MKKSRIVIPVFLFIILVSAVHAQVSSVCPIAAYEGSVVRLSPEAMDPDPEIGPAGQFLWEFGAPFNSEGVWQTRKGERGVFPFWVSVSDGELKDTEHSCVEVLINNRDPIISPVSDVYITRGENTKIEATCTDPDGDIVTINYRFNGRDVAYILYEPPGVYDLDIICTDGYGGVDSYRTKIHIDMPEPIEQPPAKHIPTMIPQETPQEVVFEPDTQPVVYEEPQEVEVVLGFDTCEESDELDIVIDQACKPDVVEIQYPQECTPCPTGYELEDPYIEDVDVVVYDSIYDLKNIADDSEVFVVQETYEEPEQEIKEPVVAPATTKESSCDDDLERKHDISRTIAGCC